MKTKENVRRSLEGLSMEQKENVRGILEGLWVHFKHSGDNYLREVERVNQCLNCKKLENCDVDTELCEDENSMCVKCVPLKKPKTMTN